MTILSVTTEKLRMTHLDGLSTEQFEVWSRLCAVSLRIKKVRLLVQNMFIKYLRPEIKGMWSIRVKYWIKNNIPMDNLIQLFIAIVHPEDFIKKKSELSLIRLFQRVTSSPSTPQSETPPDGLMSGLTEPQSLSFG